MKQYDKNSLIGFALMALILIVFNTFFFPEITNEKPTAQTTKEHTTKINDPITTAPIKETQKRDTVNDELRKIHGLFANSAVSTFITLGIIG